MASQKRIGELLLERGAINREQLEQALRLQQRGRRFLGQILIGMGWISEFEVYKTLSQLLRVKFISFDNISIDPTVVTLIPEIVAVTRDVLPIAVSDNTLYLVMDNPRDLDAIQLVEFTTDRQVKPIMAPISQLREMIRRAYNINIDASRNNGRPADIEHMGFSSGHLASYRAMLQYSQGLLLVVGPPGSGRTSTLYASLRSIGQDISRNIVTIEDPIEESLQGIKQIQIDDAAGLTFSSVLSLVHDQYPQGNSVVCVGELRDADTAQSALRLSETGHLVLSSLRTDDVVSTISHLYNLAIPSELLATELAGIVAQRVVREICPFCKTAYQPDAAELKSIGMAAGNESSCIAYRGQGCPTCQETGYAGYVGIHEMLVLDDFLRAEIAKHPTPHALHSIVRGDLEVETLLDDGIKKIRQGLTTISEVARACCTTCPGCGHAIPETASICLFCRFPVFELCRQCGAKLKLEWRLCPFCGTPKA